VSKLRNGAGYANLANAAMIHATPRP
jgi:hypothetical protein